MAYCHPSFVKMHKKQVSMGKVEKCIELYISTHYHKKADIIISYLRYN